MLSWAVGVGLSHSGRGHHLSDPDHSRRGDKQSELLSEDDTWAQQRATQMLTTQSTNTQYVPPNNSQVKTLFSILSIVSSKTVKYGQKNLSLIFFSIMILIDYFLAI